MIPSAIWVISTKSHAVNNHGILNMIYESFEDQLNNEYMVNGLVLKLGD